MPKTAKHHGVDTSPVTIRQVKYATVIAFLAWTFAVYDFILFGMLLPEIGKSINLDDAGQAQLATYVALGGVVVALAVGPVVDKFGRRFGMVFTVGGAGVASALTALAGRISPVLLVGIRSVVRAGLRRTGRQRRLPQRALRRLRQRETRQAPRHGLQPGAGRLADRRAAGRRPDRGPAPDPGLARVLRLRRHPVAHRRAGRHPAAGKPTVREDPRRPPRSPPRPAAAPNTRTPATSDCAAS